MTDSTTPANGPLFDEQGNLVKFKATKAVIGGGLGLISLVTTGLTSIYTDSIPLIITNIVVGAFATVLGIYLPTNTAVRK